MVWVRLPAWSGKRLRCLPHRVQVDSGAHPASYQMSTGGSFPGDNEILTTVRFVVELSIIGNKRWLNRSYISNINNKNKSVGWQNWRVLTSVVKLTIHLHLVPSLRMDGAIPPSPYAFMAPFGSTPWLVSCVISTKWLKYTQYLESVSTCFFHLRNLSLVRIGSVQTLLKMKYILNFINLIRNRTSLKIGKWRII